MSTAPPPAAPAGRPAAPVIRRVGGAYDPGADRLLNRHLPAWVISGALNLGVIALAWLAFGVRPAEVRSAPQPLTTSVEREPEEAAIDLTNTDTGFQSSLESALPDQKEDAATAIGPESDDAIGTPETATDATSSLAVPGLQAAELTGGAVGDAGQSLAGPGGDLGAIAATLAGRSGATKNKLLKDGGGNQESERAVAEGLRWLAAQQKKGGYWEFDPTGTDPGTKARKLDRTTATGLALLPFLAAGNTHKSGGKYSKVVDDGLRFLIRPWSRSQPDGSLDFGTGKFNSPSNQYMYGHGISTMALCEAYGMTRDKALLPAARAAVGYIVKGQAGNGSWGYAAGSPGDTSIVGWQVQALKAAQLSKDIQVPTATIDRAIAFLNEVAGGGSIRAVYGYASKGGAPGTSLTAVGLLCRYYIDGWGPGSAGMAVGVPGLFGSPRPAAKPDEPKTDRTRAPWTKDRVGKNGTVPDMYYYYYATQVVHFFGGPEWQEWNEGPRAADGSRQGGMRDWLVAIQKKTTAPPAVAGSWDPDNAHIGNNCGRLGTTCLCLLTLEVYYRHLPLYKRDQGNTQVMDLK